MSAQPGRTDVVVVGGGDAGFSAAPAAAARGRRVVLPERVVFGRRAGSVA